VAGCLEAVTELENLFPADACGIAGQNNLKGRKRKRTLAVLAWPFKQEKAQKLLSRIAQYKTAVSLAMAVELR
jgi:hypothetical protein